MKTQLTWFRSLSVRRTKPGFTDVITHWPRANGVYAGSEEVLETIVSDVIPR